MSRVIHLEVARVRALLAVGEQFLFETSMSILTSILMFINLALRVKVLYSTIKSVNSMTEDIPPTPKNDKRRKVLIVFGIVAVILVVGVGLGVRWWLQQRDYEQQAGTDAIVEVMEDSQNYMFAGDFDQAHDVVNKALDNPRLSDQAKIDLYLQQGATYESQENYSSAMESYRRAETLAPDSYGIILSIANLATLMDNKELAIEYYKKAIPLLPEDDPMREANRKYLEGWVTILEEGGPHDEE